MSSDDTLFAACLGFLVCYFLVIEGVKLLDWLVAMFRRWHQ